MNKNLEISSSFDQSKYLKIKSLRNLKEKELGSINAQTITNSTV